MTSVILAPKSTKHWFQCVTRRQNSLISFGAVWFTAHHKKWNLFSQIQLMHMFCVHVFEVINGLWANDEEVIISEVVGLHSLKAKQDPNLAFYLIQEKLLWKCYGFKRLVGRKMVDPASWNFLKISVIITAMFSSPSPRATSCNLRATGTQTRNWDSKDQHM